MDSRGREIFEALLSSPSVEAAEAWALLGTCKAARSVGGAASLKEVCAVALFTTTAHKPLEEQYAVPFVCDLFPHEGSATEYCHRVLLGVEVPEYRWQTVPWARQTVPLVRSRKVHR
jgi:hypothetical protein